MLYPNDNVIVADAHKYLEDNYLNFDFIWSSVPCQANSQMRMISSKRGSYAAVLPNMNLWAEIIFLKHYAKCKWVVENVKPYYECLITPSLSIERHYFWTNLQIRKPNFTKTNRVHKQITTKSVVYDIDLSLVDIKNKRQILRNCVNPQIGLHFLNCDELTEPKIISGVLF